MMIGAIPHRSRIGLAPARSQGGFDVKILLFLGLIGFLLFWSFWGRSIEMRIYGTSPHHRSWNDLGIQIADIPPDSQSPGIVVNITDPNAAAALDACQQVLGAINAGLTWEEAGDIIQRLFALAPDARPAGPGDAFVRGR